MKHLFMDIMCQHPGCKKQPNYNREGETKALYCGTHKQEGMIDVKNKTCQHPGCRTQPTYNREGETNALYCGTHKHEGMINVKDKTCQHPGCRKIPHYNVEGETKGLYCSTHKHEGMINVKDKTCQHPGCRTRPTYNGEGETKALYCGKHKQDGMINVVSKTCQHPGCRTIPAYNVEGETQGLYCGTHKHDGMINVVSKTCKSDWCRTHVQEKYDGYCLFCYMNLFPDKPVTRNYKTKEYAVVEHVKAAFPQVDWVSDKRVSGGCSRRRPDLFLDLGDHILIVEVDENQHTDYDTSCENKRLMELSQDVNHRPLVFIRFNPDEYSHHDVKVTSCWGINGNGICVVKKSKQKEWETRLSTLVDTIRHRITHPTDKTIDVIHLFYNIVVDRILSTV